MPKVVKDAKKKDDDVEDIVPFRQINQALLENKAKYLLPVTATTIKNINFRTPIILSLKNKTSDETYTRTGFFIRYEKDKDLVWYSMFDPIQLPGIHSMWRTHSNTRELSTSIPLIDFDNTYVIKV